MNIPEKNRGFISIFLIGGALILGYKVLQSFGVFKSSEEKQQEQAQQSTINTLKKQYTQTYTNDVYISSADFIYDSTGQHIDIASDYTEATTEIMQISMNPLDWYLLVQAYGNRQNYNFGFIPTGSKHDLPAHIKLNFPSHDIATIRRYLGLMGIIL